MPVPKHVNADAYHFKKQKYFGCSRVFEYGHGRVASLRDPSCYSTAYLNRVVYAARYRIVQIDKTFINAVRPFSNVAQLLHRPRYF